jgi:hypothetical protein
MVVEALGEAGTADGDEGGAIEGAEGGEEAGRWWPEGIGMQNLPGRRCGLEFSPVLG